MVGRTLFNINAVYKSLSLIYVFKEVATSTGHTPSKINQNEEKKSRVCVFIPEDLDSQASTQQVVEDNNSPSPVQRFKFKEFDDMGQFLGSPERKNKGKISEVQRNWYLFRYCVAILKELLTQIFMLINLF